MSIGVVPAVVVCQMADDISDLAPLHEDSGLPMQTFLRKVLIGLQAIGVPVNRRQPWIDLALILTSAPQLVFLNELFSVLGVLKDSMRSNERSSLNRCARSLIEWSWSCGEKTGARSRCADGGPSHRQSDVELSAGSAGAPGVSTARG